MRSSSALFALIIFFIGGGIVHAQLLAVYQSYIQTEIRGDPVHPSPGASVVLTLSSTDSTLKNKSILWTVDGKQAAIGVGKMSLSVVAPSVGATTIVTASASGTSESAIYLLSPAELSVIWESNSYTPPFFRGRALPSAGVQVVAEAKPHFVRNRVDISAQSLVYTWKKDGVVIASASGLGRFQATFDAPGLFGTDVITVEATTEDGLLAAETSFSVRSIDPVIELYEDNPLLGVFFNSAIAREEHVADTEIKLFAIPFYSEAETPGDNRLVYAWRVNNEPIAADKKEPGSITIAGEAGVAGLLSLSLTHTQNFFESALRDWTLLFGGQSSSFTDSNQFTGQ